MDDATGDIEPNDELCRTSIDIAERVFVSAIDLTK